MTRNIGVSGGVLGDHPEDWLQQRSDEYSCIRFDMVDQAVLQISEGVRVKQ